MNNAEVLIKFKGDTSSADKATNEVSTSLTKLTKAFTLGNIISTGITKGLGILTSNLDGAISRVDTLNNFPKVMSNLGISAYDSAEVISDLSKKLQGLPTSIDSAAMAVQRFTSKNGNVKESEKIFLAVNNAILAGGAGADIQASALEQLSQAYAKGKPDMMEWRTLMTAMPAQLTQVAKAMGYIDAASLGQAVREDGGEKEFARMIDTMMKMNTEGINGFKSFEDQARNATGGIQTNIKNMKTAFVRGIADIIKQVDNALEPFGGLGGVITSMGKIGEKVFKKLGNILAKVIKAFVKLAQWINKNKDWIIPLTIAIGTFIATFKTIKTVIAIINAVKTAMAALNAIILANPIAILVAAIAALVAAFIYLWNNCEAFRNFWIGLWENIKNIVSTVVEAIKTTLSTIINVVKGIIEKIKAVVTPILEFIEGVFILIVALSTNLIDRIMKVIIPIVQWIWNNVLSPVINTFKTAFNTVWNVIKTIFDGIKNTISNVFNFIKNNIVSPVANFFKTAFSNAADAIKKVFEGMKDALKTVFDGLVGIIKAPLNLIIDAINKVIGGLNKLSIKIPSWVPKYGGKRWGVNISKIPKLEVGTNYVPQDTLAVIHEGEAVVPKKFNPYANGMNSSMLGVMNNSHSKQIINVYANFKQDNLGQVVRDIKTFSGGARNDYNYGM